MNWNVARVFARIVVLLLFVGSLIALLHSCKHGMRPSSVADILSVFNRLQASRHVRAGEALFSQGRVDEAKTQLSKALELDPKSFAAHSLLIVVYLSEGDVRSVEKLFKHAEANLPIEQVSLLYTYAGDRCAFFEPRNWDAAERYYRRALILNPRNAVALNNYGYALAERGIKLEKAEELIKRALELEPNNGAYLDSLGWVYYKQGRYEEAIELIEKAIKLQPDDAELHYHLGMAYMAVGRLEDAKRQFEEALKMNPNHKGASDAIKQLEQEEEETPQGEMA
jgi:tetratricopeptide (TPR) repeat protein